MDRHKAKAKVPHYTLPDLLTTQNGAAVKTVKYLKSCHLHWIAAVELGSWLFVFVRPSRREREGLLELKRDLSGARALSRSGRAGGTAGLLAQCLDVYCRAGAETTGAYVASPRQRSSSPL